jgi:hypothetical protein
MQARKSVAYMPFLLLLSSLIVSCSAKSQGIVLSANRTYDEIFEASLAAVHETDFSVTSNDIQTGSIVAVKHIDAEDGHDLRMQVRVNRVATGTEVVVTVSRPSGTPAAEAEPCKCNVKSFVYALENRLPDVNVVSIQ